MDYAHIEFLYPVTKSSILEWKKKQTEIIILKKTVSLFDRLSMERVVCECLMFPELKIGISLRINS